MNYILLKVSQVFYIFAKKIKFKRGVVFFNNLKHTLCKRIICKDFGNNFFLKKRIFSNDAINKNVFVFWYQDAENAPEIVKKCIQSIKKAVENSDGRSFKLISFNNYNKYVNLPNYIIEKVKKGKISKIHFADILRFNLLAQCGGLWIDATCFLSNNNFLREIENSNFFTLKNCFKDFDFINGKWTSFFIGGAKDNLIANYMVDCFNLWFKNHNKVLTYLMLDCFLSLGYEKINEIKNMIDDVISISKYDSNKIFKLNDYYFLENNHVDEMLILIANEDIHKLSYKIKYYNYENSCYNYFVNNLDKLLDEKYLHKKEVI